MNACELAHELVRRVRNCDVAEAIGLFDPDAEVTAAAPTVELSGLSGSSIAEFCAWLAETFPGDAPVEMRIAGQEGHAVIVFQATGVPPATDGRPTATIWLDVSDRPRQRVTRVRVLLDSPGSAGLRQATTDAREDANRDRYVRHRRPAGGGQQPG